MNQSLKRGIIFKVILKFLLRKMAVPNTGLRDYSVTYKDAKFGGAWELNEMRDQVIH
jgi:hypothetical protein